jgi:hypothetical protein
MSFSCQRISFFSNPHCTAHEQIRCDTSDALVYLSLEFVEASLFMWRWMFDPCELNYPLIEIIGLMMSVCA